METFRIVIDIACAVFSVIHLLEMVKYRNKKDTLEAMYHGIWAVIMLLVYKL